MAQEIWVPVISYEDLYEVSNTGAVFSKLRNRNLNLQDVDGYLRVRLYDKSYLVHRVVYCSFNRIPLEFISHKYSVICHKNDVRSDNRLENLYIGTQMENVHDMMRKGRYIRRIGFRSQNASLNDEQVRSIRNRYKTESMYEIAKDFPQISKIGLWKCAVGKTYKTTQALEEMQSVR